MRKRRENQDKSGNVAAFVGQYLLMLDDAFVYNHGYEPTGINAVTDNNGKDVIKESYAIDGQRTEHLSRGVNIVKMKDGSTRKIIVR